MADGCHRKPVNWQQLDNRYDIMIMYNYLPMLRDYIARDLENLDVDKLQEIMELACRWGSLEMFKFLNTIYPINSPDDEYFTGLFMGLAATRGRMDIIQYIHLNNRPQGMKWRLSWASGGNVETFKYFESIDGIYCDTNTLDHASSLELVKYIHHNRTEGCTTDAMDYAAVQGRIDIVKFLHFNRTEGCTTWAMDGAASHGHMDVLEFLHFNRTEGCTTSAMDMDRAIDSLKAFGAISRTDILRFLHLNRTEGCTTSAINKASQVGDFEAVRFLNENRSEGCTVTAMNRAKSLEILQYLHQYRTEGCDIDAFQYSYYTNDRLRHEFLKLNYQHINPERKYWLLEGDTG
eukprot:gene7480-8751_t